MKRVWLIAVSLGLLVRSVAQQPPRAEGAWVQLTGSVTDSLGAPLYPATVTCTTQHDTLHTFSSPQGTFAFQLPPDTLFTITITMKAYGALSKSYHYHPSEASIHLDPIRLYAEYKDLDPVIVTGVRAITVTEDTVSYRAAAYAVRDGAEVQDILKRLPGVEVDADGNVIVRGKKIEKVLVDGKEFFGGDVLLAIQNLPADIVDKLQVIDDYGDKARLTSVRSGDASKVLNIVLRPDRRNGQFGRLDAAAGDQGRYTGSAFGNELQGERQMGTRIAASNNSPAGNDPAHNGGVNYANQWGPSWGLASSISTSGQSPQSVVSTTTNSYYPGEALEQIQDNHSDSRTGQTSLSSRLTYKPDPNTTIRLATSGSTQSSNTHVTSNFTNLQQDSGYTKTTTGNSGNQAQATAQYFVSNLYFEKTHPTDRRRFSIEANFGYNGSSTANDNQSSASIVTDSSASTSFLHDLTNNDTRTWNAALNANYFLPAGPTAFLELGYGASTSVSRTNLFTQEADSAGLPPTPVDSLTQHTLLTTINQRAHAGYTAKIRRLDLTVGLDAQPGEMKGTADAKGDLATYHYLSLVPVLQAAWNLDRKRRLRFGYNGQPNLPSLQQLTPLTNLSNPQYPVTGNPNLKQSYTHRLSLNYEQSDLKATQFFGYGLGIEYSATLHTIIANLVTPQDSGQIIQATTYLNAGATNNLSANYHLTLPAFFHRIFRVMLAGSVTRNSSITMTNDVQYLTQSWTGAPTAHLQLMIPDKIESDLSGSYGVTRTVYPGSPTQANTFRSASLNLSSRHYFLRKWVLNYQLAQSFTGTGPRLLTLPPSLTASIQRQFLPHNTATISLSGYNLFNESAAAGQSFSPTTITASKPQLTGRYFLLSFQLKLQRFRK